MSDQGEITLQSLHDRLTALEKALAPNPFLNPPTKEEVWLHQYGKGREDFDLDGFMKYWEDHNWYNKNGVPVKNWKLCATQWYRNQKRYR